MSESSGTPKARVSITGPADVAVVATHILGFVPHDSLILLGVGGQIPSARIDFPHDHAAMIDVAEALTQSFNQFQGTGATLILTAWTQDTTAARTALAVLAPMLTEIANVPLAIQVRDGDQGAESWSDHSDLLTEEPDHTGPWPTGAITTADRDRFAVEFMATGGAVPAASRQAKATRFNVDQEDIEAVERALPQAVKETHARQVSAADQAEWRGSEVAWIEQATATGREDLTTLTPSTVARVLVALEEDDATRESLTVTLHRATAQADHDVWTQIARRAPAKQREAPQLLAALTAWLSGDGASAWIALDAVDTLPQAADRAPEVLHQVIATALANAHHPDTWEQAIHGHND